MRIVVCVKQVPDEMSAPHYDAGGRVHRTADDATLGRADEAAVRAAVALAARHDERAGVPADARPGVRPDVRPGARPGVTVLTMGPTHALRALRRGLQLGADRAVLVTDPALAGSDVFATAAVLAAAVRAIAPDGRALVLTGTASQDARTSVLPVLLAAELGVPCASGATDVALRDGVVRVRRETAGTSRVDETDGSAVVSVIDTGSDDGPVGLAAIRAARSAPVQTWGPADLGLDPGGVGPAAARTRVVEAAPSPPVDRVLVVDDGTAGDLLADYLLGTGVLP
ncbi:electron transfer flavoprotein subunit beta [Cellulomonas sp. ATA003]|uniref:electron transfer flavoprotein subunit beta/FixA family protein n=1 Tax=Cellulomonas sp. ATA003 TaxID=3073064 RepID=UPI0028730559|nr:electron transfer flavoprotein subunit beta [Cellulomonas sp. ATA003]WNB87258.1 electron transfer flavoprotein subunit beta [Cellulomonas sp. ATA003]